MRVLWTVTPATLLLVAALTVLAAWSRSSSALGEARIPLVLAAASCYGVGFFVFNAVWAWLVSPQFTARPGSEPGRATAIRAFFVGLLSLSGLLTPMNFGTDVLRSLLARRYLGAPATLTAAASIVTREWKLHVTLVLLPAAAASGVGSSEQRVPVLVAVGGLLGLALVFAVFRSQAACDWAKSLRVTGVAETARRLHGRTGVAGQGLVYVMFAVGFAAEWQALRLCIAALGARIDFGLTLAAFGMLYFLSRTPIIPLGIGVVESAGFAWFRMVDVPVEQAGALIVLWSSLRVAVPHVLSALALLALGAARIQEPAVS